MFLLLKFNAFQSSTKDITTLFINDGIISNLKKMLQSKKVYLLHDVPNRIPSSKSSPPDSTCGCLSY